MSYQALLFCLDERLARVVTQVFSELDFTVEPVNEPFAAVKKLMAQRYDAVVVDCENEPNAALIFKSARNSSSNQSSLALALVEGQAGVAKAYRIGANLVLTKPINIEQAKGTLRVARGLLRKNVEAAPAPAAAPPRLSPAPPPIPAPTPAEVRRFEAPPAHNGSVIPEIETALPAMAASAAKENAPAAMPVPEVKTKVLGEADAAVRTVLPSSLFEAAQPAPQAASKNPVSSPLSGAASAPAPAREIAPPVEPKPAVVPAAESREANSPSFSTASIGSSPSFGTIDEQDSDGSGGNKKLLIIAAVVVVAAVAGFFGWTKISTSSGPSQSVSAPQKPVIATSPAPASALPSTAASPASSASVAPTPLSIKPSATLSTPAADANSDDEVVTRKIAPPAIVVKSSTASAAKKTQAPASTPADDSAPQLPNPLTVSNPARNLGGIVSSVPTAMPTAAISMLKISQGVSQGLLIKRVQPRYPANALAMRIQGAVQLQATINREGNITNLKAITGDQVLVRAASEAVKQWRYKPYYLNGEPVDIETQITVNFKLPN